MTRSLTAPHLEAEKVSRQVAAVADREFAPAGGAAAEAVREHVRAARAGYGSPAVLTYLSVLVERYVRLRLPARPTS